jgi:hypothetical protein
MSFPLKRIAVDPQTLIYLDEHLLTRLAFSMSNVKPGFTVPIINLKKPQLQIRLGMPTPAFNFSINQHQLNDYVP